MTQLLVSSLVSCILATLSFLYGRLVGRSDERERCLNLCAQGNTLSTTARRIYNSINSGRRDLISEEEFFGEERDEKLAAAADQAARARCTHRNTVPTSAGEFCADCGAEL